MAESYSVKAVLSAVDKNFSSTLNGALEASNTLKSTLASGIGFGVMMSIGQNAFSAISSGFSSVTKEALNSSDSMQKLQKSMRFSGYAEDEIQRIAGATGTLKTYADKTVFSLQDVMSTFGSLSANGVQDADKLTESVGNAVAVFGGGATEFSGVALAFSQAMATGALHAQDWNQIVNASPQLAGGLRKELIKLNPTIGNDFKGAMEDGAISADMLGQAMNNIGMTDAAKEAATSVTTLEGAIGNMEATVESGVMGIYDTFIKADLVGLINGINGGLDSAFGYIGDLINRTKPYFSAFIEAFNTVKAPVSEAVQAVGQSLADLNGSFGSMENVDTFKGACQTVADAISSVAGFIKDHSKEIAQLINVLPKLFIAYKSFQLVSSIAPGVMSFGKGILSLAKGGIEGLAAKLFGTAAGEEAAGAASAGASGSVLQAAVAFIALGVGVLAASAGIALLANAAIQISAAGPAAVVALLGMVVVLALLAVGASILGPALTAGAVGFVAFGVALLAVGVATLLACTGLAILANVMPLIVQYGLAAALNIGVLGVALTVFSIGAAVAGVACVVLAAGVTVLAAGLVLAGAAFLIAGAGGIALGVGLTASAAGAGLLAVALGLCSSDLDNIAGKATEAESSLGSMETSIDVVSAGLDTLGSLAQAAMSDFTAAFSNARGNVQNEATEITFAFRDGIWSGFEPLPKIANQCMTNFASGLNAGNGQATQAAAGIANSVKNEIGHAGDNAFDTGYYIGAGLASGMSSALGQVQSMAAQLSAAADEAIRKKQQIASPAKRQIRNGEYTGEGFVVGLKRKYNAVKQAAKNLVNIPAAQAGTAGAGVDLQADYSYTPVVYVQAQVQSVLDGRAVGYGTAEYVQEKNDFESTRKNRLGGVVNV